MKYLLAFFFLHENIFETITYIDIKYVDSKDKPFFKKKKVGLIRTLSIKFTFYTRLLLLIFRLCILIVLTNEDVCCIYNMDELEELTCFFYCNIWVTLYSSPAVLIHHSLTARSHLQGRGQTLIIIHTVVWDMLANFCLSIYWFVCLTVCQSLFMFKTRD